MQKNLLQDFEKQLIKNKVPKKAVWWENYVKHETKFLGVPMAELCKILKNWYSQNSLQELTLHQHYDLANSLLAQQYSEQKLAGILLYELYIFDLEAHLLNFLKNSQVAFDKYHIFDWNICDWFCVKVFSKVVEQKNPKANEFLLSWADEQYVWKARAGVVAFVLALNDSALIDSALLQKIIKKLKILIKREERFAKTAVGWCLREISKRNLKLVLEFLKEFEDYITSEVKKNATKYIK